MDKDEVVYIRNEILFGHKKEWNLAICDDMDESRECTVKQKKSVSETKIPYDCTHVWNLRNKTNEWRGKKRDKSGSRLLTLQNKLMVTMRGGVLGETGDAD